jgi:hypothetical protein
MDFANIPQTFTHLQIKTFLRMQANQGVPYDLTITVNGANPTQFAFHRLSGNGAGASSANYINDNLFRVPLIVPNAFHTSNVFGTAVIDILDYNNASKGKTLRAIGGQDVNGGTEPNAGWANLTSSMWSSLSAITSLSFASFGNFAIGSRVDLYGITSNPIATGA